MEDDASVVLDAMDIVRTMNIKVGWQEDAHEFLLKLLEEVSFIHVVLCQH